MRSPDAIDAAAETPPSFAARLQDPRTVITTAVALLIVGVAIVRAPINWHEALDEMRRANVWLYLLAVIAYYTSFVVRSYRWSVLLRNAGEATPARTLLSTIITSFFVNCVVPAKMGDVYRAYMVRQREGVKGTKALGTIIAERLMDLSVLMGLLFVAALLTFGGRVPRELIPAFLGGVVMCGVGIGFVVALSKGRGQRVLVRLPERAVERYEHFRLGTVDALGDNIPVIVALTVLVWALEATRLGLVVFALHYGSLLGPAQFLLVALVAALLTTVPALPGGLGLVEFGIVGVLVQVVDVSHAQALSIALLDRSISYGSLIVIGFLVFARTHASGPRRRPGEALPAP